MTVTVDSSGFTAMTRELAKISGKTHREAIDAEAEQVLSVAARYIGAAKATAYPRFSKLPAAQQAEWRAAKKRGEEPMIRLLGRGLSKKSWQDVATSLALRIKGLPAYAKRATAQDGTSKISGSGRRDDAGSKYFVEIENHYPLIQRSGTGEFDGRAVLTRAIQTRIKAFLFALRKSVFTDLKLRARRYPKLFSVS